MCFRSDIEPTNTIKDYEVKEIERRSCSTHSQCTITNV